MKIWIDPDAAPRDVKEITARAAKRLELRICYPPGLCTDRGGGYHSERQSRSHRSPPCRSR